MKSKNKSNVKTQIADAFHKVLKEKSIEKITVADVMRTCGKTRQMFYHYFKDLDDLILWIHLDKTHKYAEVFFDSGAFLYSGAQYFEEMSKDREFYKHIVKKQGYHSYTEFYYRLMMEYVETYLKKYRAHTLTEEEHFAMKLFWRGVTAMMVEWINNDMKLPPLTLNKRFFMCMPPILKKHYDIT